LEKALAFSGEMVYFIEKNEGVLFLQKERTPFSVQSRLWAEREAGREDNPRQVCVNRM